MADIKPIDKALFLREEYARDRMCFSPIVTLPAKLTRFLRNKIWDGRIIDLRMGRHPGITVSDLLGILNITKQSLSRVLSGLMRNGFVSQKTGVTDRQQLLYDKTGLELEARLTALQGRRFAAAYREAGAEPLTGFRRYCEV